MYFIEYKYERYLHHRYYLHHWVAMHVWVGWFFSLSFLSVFRFNLIACRFFSCDFVLSALRCCYYPRFLLRFVCFVFLFSIWFKLIFIFVRSFVRSLLVCCCWIFFPLFLLCFNSAWIAIKEMLSRVFSLFLMPPHEWSDSTDD